jgi:hypothetical protein
MAVEFSTEVRLGDILTIISFVGVGFAAYYKIKGRQDIQDIKFDYMDKDVKGFKGTMARLSKEHDEIKDEQNTINGRINYLGFRMGDKPDGEYDKLGHKKWESG